MSERITHEIGLLLGLEEDWPSAFEQILGLVGEVKDPGGATHTFTSRRLGITPFDLRDPVQSDLVIDRLGYWYHHPREWLKKASLMNDTYLLNSPFTFQSMEKHSAYCAMIRLGLKIPPTVLIPYPLYMKPFDGGGWRGVSRVDDVQGLHAAYDASENMLMHLQATVDYEKFARALSIGAETMVMDFRPDEPMHNRYAVSHDFLSPSAGHQAAAISRIINAFFRWEFNSAEMLVTGDEVYPIDYANACPDVAVTSLHYYFPWALTALVRWSAFSLATGRKAEIDLETREYFAIADDPDRTYEDKLEAYLALADDYFEVDKYAEWTEQNLPHLNEQVAEWVRGPRFDELLVSTVKSTYPEHEHEKFLGHFRGLTGMWADDQR